MIKLNGKEVMITRFPDNTIKFDLQEDILPDQNEVVWNFESMEELFTLVGLANKLKSTKANLYLPYLPNARMDKVQNDNEGLMLEYFVSVVDGLGFNKITILDPHSEVYKKWAKHTEWIQDEDMVKSLITFTIDTIERAEGSKVSLVYPDKGACDRYTKLLDVDDFLYGVKERNQATGEITSFDLVGDITDNPVLIVDDICSKGGTFYYTAKKLRDKGFIGNIYLYVTHTEDTIEDGELLKDYSDIKRVFTTDSILSKDIRNTTIYEL